jgi:exodeoxyribonuclease III
VADDAGLPGRDRREPAARNGVKLISANLNGIRAAARRGGLAWLARQDADVITLQEVRATTDQVAKALADEGLGDYHLAHAEADQPGRAGVAILSRMPLEQVLSGLPACPDAGRWLEARTADVVVASCYVHTGEAGTPRQAEKHRFLDAMTERMAALPDPAIVTGDLNIAHREVDIKNWRGNVAKAGFLTTERAYFDAWSASGWVDLGRMFGGPGPGPYTWWSWRGKAFDNDAGWRIDHALATTGLAARVAAVAVGRAPTYAQRWSDHAPVIVQWG